MTTSQIIETLLKTNFIDANKFESIDIIAEIQKYIKPFPYKKGDTFSTKEYAILNNITTKKAYILLTNFEKNDVVCKYGYKTKFGWEDIDESNLKTNSIHWQVCN